MFTVVISRRWIRWLVRLVVYATLFVLCLLVSSRWWLPAVLPGLLGNAGIVVDSVEREPGGGLGFSGVVMETEAARVQVDAVGLPSVVIYLWELSQGEWSAASAIEVGQVTVELLRQEQSASQSAPVYLPELYRAIEGVLGRLDRWLPEIRVDTVEIAREAEAVASLSEITYSSRLLEASGSLRALDGAVRVRARLARGAEWILKADHENSGFALDVSVGASEGVVIVSSVLANAKQSELDFKGRFGADSWLPVEAQARTDLFTIDPRWLPAREGVDWKGLRISELDFQWEGGNYRGALQAAANLDLEAVGSDELFADFAFSGDLEKLKIETGEVVGNWIRLSIRDPFELRLRDGGVMQNALLRVDLDLSKQPFFEASGRVGARLRVTPSSGDGSDVQFELSGEDLALEDYKLSATRLSGHLRGDVLSIEEMSVQLASGAEESAVSISGAANLSSRELDFEYELVLPAEWLNERVGEPVLAGMLMAEGRLSGDIKRPLVEGALKPLELELPGMVPLAVSGEYRMEGRKRLFWSGQATVDDAAIEADLEAALSDDAVAVVLNRLAWRDADAPVLELRAPMPLEYRLTGNPDVPEARLRVAPFQLSGADAEIRGQWGPEQGLEFSLRNFDSQRVSRWVRGELPEVRVESVAASFPKLRPHLSGSLDLAAEVDLTGSEAPVRVDVGARFAADGFLAERLRIHLETTNILQGFFSLPVTFQLPTDELPFWSLRERGALEGELSAVVSPQIGDWLEQYTGVRIGGGTLDAQLGGTRLNPLGRLALRVNSLNPQVAGLPMLDRLEIDVVCSSEQIEIERANLSVNQSELSGTFRAPVEGLVEAVQGGARSWRTWLSNGSGRIELDDWRTENWSDVLPGMMRQSGRLGGALELRPGWDVCGSLSFEDFALRPTSNLPSVGSIEGQLELSERRLSVREASARIGGSPVELAGWVDAADFDALLWNFTASGENVPLVRTADMILRSDLALEGSLLERSQTPLIEGDLNLRSSTLLAAFDPLAPNVESGPQARPPYFSITAPAVADWRFDLKIDGDSFMRVRSPYFRSQLSANFDLGGTFAEPLLVGSIRTVDGELRFPGAKMRIARGEAFIEPSQPNTVQVDFDGTAQTASKIISMRVSQTLDDPLIQFRSTPPLPNSTIVRLLATGSTTGGGVGAVGLYLGQGFLGSGGLDEQLSDRLTIDMGEDTSRSGRNTVSARYELSEDYSLEGDYDVYDAYNLDLIWSIFKK